ncbi:hypothetical protein [Desulfonema magnum]|uniref:CRISPR-associated protein n=1 Tax=Desulfonema magnum TaxID=45655 RepID=A0A975BUH3_9BACT|nr:hypothetical protein [Desulfonema magnum]QTA91969.1 CRISPR-associated protein [Desulfonema magnum]
MFENRIELLEKIDDDENWEEVLDNNYLNYLEYQELYHDRDFGNATDVFKKLLPEYFNVIHLINRKHVKEGYLPDFDEAHYDIGIFLVGYSIMPIILSLAEIRPGHVIFVVTEDTEDLVDEIMEGIEVIDAEYYEKIKADIRLERLEELSDPARIFKTINALILENEGRKIAIDITGGKKTMVAGSFMASAHSQTCDIFYVDFEEYDLQRREPCYGTEFLAKLPNPSEIFSIVDWERIKSLFDRYQFGRVKNELSRIEKNIRKHEAYFDEETKEGIKKITTYACGYECWDDYRYKEALDHLPDEPALKVLGKIEEYYGDKLRFHKKTANSFPEANEEAIRETKSKICSNNEWLSFYLLDRLKNARRRKSQSQLQGTFLRFITLTEFVLILWAEKENVFPLNTHDSQTQSSASHIGFTNVLNWLENNGSVIAEDVNVKELKKLKNIRNNHVLIHSIKVVDDMNDLKRAEEYAEKIIQNLLKMKGVNEDKIKAVRQALEFKKFNELVS